MSPDELYSEITRSYQEFRETVDQFNKSTTKCKEAIARYGEVMERYTPPDEEAEKTVSTRVSSVLSEFRVFRV